MRKIILALSILLSICTYSRSFAYGNETDLKINNKVSSIEWVGVKVTGQHTGNINIKEGTLQLNDGIISSGKIVIDMNSITNTDMEGEWSEKLIGHLNSADFFDVKNYATSTLEISSTKNISGNKYSVLGNLTIKNITKPIVFEATIEIKEGKLAAYAEIKIDRTLYDIKYGSGKFFEGLGDKMIDDQFIIKFKIAAE